MSDVNHFPIDYSNLGARHNDNAHYTTPIKGCSERQIKTPPYVMQKLDSSSTHYFTERQSNDVPHIESSMGGPGETHMYDSSIQSRGANGASELTQPVLGPATNSIQQYLAKSIIALMLAAIVLCQALVLELDIQWKPLGSRLRHNSFVVKVIAAQVQAANMNSRKARMKIGSCSDNLPILIGLHTRIVCHIQRLTSELMSLSATTLRTHLLHNLVSQSPLESLNKMFL